MNNIIKKYKSLDELSLIDSDVTKESRESNLSKLYAAVNKQVLTKIERESKLFEKYRKDGTLWKI